MKAYIGVSEYISEYWRGKSRGSCWNKYRIFCTFLALFILP